MRALPIQQSMDPSEHKQAQQMNSTDHTDASGMSGDGIGSSTPANPPPAAAAATATTSDQYCIAADTAPHALDSSGSNCSVADRSVQTSQRSTRWYLHAADAPELQQASPIEQREREGEKEKEEIKGSEWALAFSQGA
jgi:hypothetical protein